MEFVATFLVCLFILLLLVVALVFGRPPVYRPSREYVLNMIEGMISGEQDQDAWTLFVGLPIIHDPELEEIRLSCYELELDAESGGAVSFGSARYRYNDQGMDRLKLLRGELEQLILKTPVFKSF